MASYVTAADAVFSPDAALVESWNAIYDQLVDHYPTHKGKEISAQERDKKGLRVSTLVYGEIRFEPYANAFLKIKQLYGGLSKPGGVFYDIGSGTGKPVFAASLVHDWDRCIGIEILEGLHAASNDMLDTWKSDEFQCLLTESAKKVDISFICGDITKYDWTDADVIFANSTCYDEHLMKQIAVTANNMKVGSFAITFTKYLPSHKWKVLESNVEMMTWGGATVYIQKKVIA